MSLLIEAAAVAASSKDSKEASVPSSPQVQNEEGGAVVTGHQLEYEVTDFGDTLAKSLAASLTCPKLRYIRKKCEVFLDQPESSTPALYFAMFSFIVIIFNSVLGVVQSLPKYVESNDKFWDNAEAACVIWFTVEFVARLCVTSNIVSFLLDPLNAIDVLAIMPFYLELIFGSGGGSSLTMLRLLRLLRSMRLAKMSRYSNKVQVLGRSLKNSLSELVILLGLFMIAVIIGSTFMYNIESGSYDEEAEHYVKDGEISEFDSIPAGFYWTVITMSTVGYGDHNSITNLSQFCVALFSLTGIVMISMPISVVGLNFNQEWRKIFTAQNLVSDIVIPPQVCQSSEFLDCFKPLAELLENPVVSKPDAHCGNEGVLAALLASLVKSNDAMMRKAEALRVQQRHLQTMTEKAATENAKLTFLCLLLELCYSNLELSKTDKMELMINDGIRRAKLRNEAANKFGAGGLKGLLKSTVKKAMKTAGAAAVQLAAGTGRTPRAATGGYGSGSPRTPPSSGVGVWANSNNEPPS